MSGGERTQSVVHLLEEHNHSVQKVYPSGADAITLTGGAAAWIEGSKTEIVPVNTITDAFDIHWASLVAGANDEFEIYIYKGLAGSEELVATITLERLNVFAASFPVSVMTPLIAANERISASCASSAGGLATCTIKITYHEY